jgi:hypothetical protein
MPAQQWMSVVQGPPLFRQQLRSPSELMPLLAHTTEPPVWLHWLVDVHSEPRPRPLVPPPPPQEPLLQMAPPQQ